MKHSSSLFHGALWAEAVKVIHSKILWVSLAAAVALPIMFGLVLAGIIPTNVPVPVGVGFNEYAEQLGPLMAVGGLIGFGFIFSWLFGREYADGTITDLLALPVARGTIVAAKFTIGIVWCAFLAAAVFSTGIIMAEAVGIGRIDPGSRQGRLSPFRRHNVYGRGGVPPGGAGCQRHRGILITLRVRHSHLGGRAVWRRLRFWPMGTVGHSRPLYRSSRL